MKRLLGWWQAWRAESDRRVRMGRILGLLFIAAGFVVIGLAWEGAASVNLRVDSQFPYLLSGGLSGIGLIVVGSTLLLVSSVRAERTELTRRLDDLNRLLTRNLTKLEFAGNGQASMGDVVPGSTVYHRPGCKILEGKETFGAIPVEQAVAEGLAPCRVCKPPVPPETEAKAEGKAEAEASPS